MNSFPLTGSVRLSAQLAMHLRESEKSHGEQFHRSVSIAIELRHPHDHGNSTIESYDVSALEELPKAEVIAQQIVKHFDLSLDGISCDYESALQFATGVVQKAASIHRFLDKGAIPESKPTISSAVKGLLS